jgi:hypothetical protein
MSLSCKDPCATLPDTFRRVAHFGMQMKREADRGVFYEAKRRVFISDGLA